MAGSWRWSQKRSVDGVRWLPSSTGAWNRMAVASLYDLDSDQAMLELSALCHDPGGQGKPRLEMRSQWLHPARFTTLSTAPLEGEASLVAAGTVGGSVGFLILDAVRPSASSKELLVCPDLHQDVVCGVDIQVDTKECISVGDDGKVSLVKLAQADLQSKCLQDSDGLVSFSAVHWASPMEFVTAGIGAPLQWWDSRRPGGAVSQCHLKWDGLATGFIHSIDVHPSRKHLCVAGGSGGSVFAWDLRWHQEAVKLAAKDKAAQIVESEVWEVKYDHVSSAATYGADALKVPPVIMCSEDGVLAVIEGGNVSELLAEPCAINSFDVDTENGKDVICALEHESILYLRRDM